jgi:hypothetical protein
MATFEERINEFLKSMGFPSVGLTSNPPDPPQLKTVTVNHMGCPVHISDDNEYFLVMIIAFAYLPRVNVAPFFRRLLELQGLMGGPCFTFQPDGLLKLQMCRQLEGLDFVEFKVMLDHLVGTYYQRVMPLVNEFQLPTQPAQV